MLYTTLILIAVIGIGAAIILNLPSFGKTPSGERLARIQQSPNYREGKFQNLEPTQNSLPMTICSKLPTSTSSPMYKTSTQVHQFLQYRPIYVLCLTMRWYGSGILLIC